MKPAGRTLMVWQEPPYEAWADRWDAACVKVFDGRPPAVAGFFNWRDNACRWLNFARGLQTGLWAVATPGDGPGLADAIAPLGPGVHYLILEMEGGDDADWDAAHVIDIRDQLRKSVPRLQVGLSVSGALPANREHYDKVARLDGIVDFTVVRADIGLTTADRERLYAMHSNPYLMVAPEHGTDWLDMATASVHHSGGVFVWRAGQAETRQWAGQIPGPAPVVEEPAPADPIRPEPAYVHLGPGLFIAWNGSRWWVTDATFRTQVTEDQVRGLVRLGMQVVGWADCENVTIQA